jgi:hypothetical protein
MRLRCLSALLAAVICLVPQPVKAQQVDSRQSPICDCGDICKKTMAKCMVDRCNGKKPAAKSSQRHEEKLAKNSDQPRIVAVK